MRWIAFSLRRPTAVGMFVLAILFTGLASVSRLPLELTPDVSYPKLSVVTYWYDTSPEIVEAFVTAPIEAVASTVSNVRSVDSISEEGKSTVNIEFNRGTEMDFAALELSEKLSVVRESLPYGVMPPRIQKYVPKQFQTGMFLSYHVTGDFSPGELRRYTQEYIRPALLAVNGVAEVQVLGGKDVQLKIQIDPFKLRAFGLGLGDIRSALGNVNIRMAAGRLFRANRKYDLIVTDPPISPGGLEKIILARRGHSLVRMGDVCSISLGYGQPRSYIRINGRPAVVLNIRREAGTNVIKVADRVFERLAQLKKNFPSSLHLIKERDQSEKIRTELSNLASRSGFCILVIFLVLLLFLRNLISPAVILLTIFFSVLLTFNLFYFAGISLNLLTLAGLALGFGMLVDNSIVVYDNILRHHEQGAEPFAAALSGTREVILPIVAATLTTVAAFIPFLYLTGELRIYYLPFAMAVGSSLLSSLLVAFTFTPSFTLQLLKRRPRHFRPAATVASAKKKEQRIYARILAFSIRHKFLTLLLTLAVFSTSYYLFDRYVTKGRIWEWGGETYLVVSIRMPSGAELERTDQVARMIEKRVLHLPFVDRVYTTVTSDFGRIEITFPRKVQNSVYPYLLKEQLISQAAQIGGPNVGVYGFGEGFFRGGGIAPNFYLEVLGYNYNEVKRIAEDVGKKLQRNPRVRDVNTNSSFWYREKLHELVLRIDRKKLRQFDLTAVQILSVLRSYLRETLAWQRIRMGKREIEYQIKMKGYRQFDLDHLQALLIDIPGHQKVRLSQVATLEEREVLSRIVRKDQQYQRWISFEFRGPYPMGDRFTRSIVENTQLPPGYKLQLPRYAFLREQEKRQIYWVMAFSILLVYMVTAALFESLLYPFVVMLTVPMALIGVFLIFYLTGTNFDRSAYIGVILLAGIVVNNAIILVHHFNLLRQKGLVLLDAVIQGAQDRLRPILMTSATTILGLLPLLLFAGAKEGIWYALALSTIGGLLSSTVLVLLVTPVLYVLFSRRKV